MNWKLRLKNRYVLTAIVLALITFVYQILGIFGVVPSISKSEIIELAGLVINVLVAVGIVVDPTTKGFGDSDLAMTYEEPKGDDYFAD